MITDTLLIVGPGGIGKSPLEKLLRDQIARIDPYRLRSDGPRDRTLKDGKFVGEKDVLYAHPKLRDELYITYQRLGLGLTCLSERVHWFPQSSTLFLKVRDEWQLLLLDALAPGIAKAEIFAPAVPVILENPQVRRAFGRVSMVVLNPAEPLHKLTDLGPIKDKTRQNCQKRHDPLDSVEKRVKSVDEEAGAWRQMIALGWVSWTISVVWGIARRFIFSGGPRCRIHATNSSWNWPLRPAARRS